MSRYEAYLKAKPELESVIRNIYLARGRTSDGKSDPRNDKATCVFGPGINRSRPRLLNDTWTPALIELEMSYGYYGSSSGYRAIDETTAYYVMRACNVLKDVIAEKAQELARRDLEALRLNAVTEAREVIADTQRKEG